MYVHHSICLSMSVTRHKPCTSALLLWSIVPLFKSLGMRLLILVLSQVAVWE